MSNKSLPVVLILLVLAVAGYLATQFAGGGAAPVAPGAGGEATADTPAPASGEAAPAAGGVLEAGAAERRAVAEVGSGVADASVPCLVGIVEDHQGQPVADAQVLCGPRGGAMFDIDWENVDAFDPDTMANMARRAQAQRVAVNTGPDGRFRIRPPAGSGEVSLRITARGHRVFDRSTGRPGAADLDLGALRLELGAVIQGRVLDPRGNPIEGARVLRLQDMEAQFAGFDVQMPGMEAFEDMRQGDAATSDADGRFELPNARPGEFVLRARHPDRPSASSPKLTVAGGATLANVILTLPVGATIRGTLVGAPEGQKNLRAMASQKRDASTAIPGMPDLGGMDVLGMMGDAEEMFGGMGLPFGERQVELGADGSFEFRGLEPGKTYRVWAVQQGRGFVGGGQCTARVEVAAGTDNVELRYEAGVTVTMTVRGADDQPVEQLSVRERLRGGEGGMMDFAMELGGGGGRARPAKYPEGKVTIANLRPKKGQKLTVEVASLGFADWQREGIELPATGSVDLGVVTLQPVPTVSVLVTAADGGAPIAGARVRLTPERNRETRDPQAVMEQFVGGRGNRTATTDAQGRVAMNALGDVAGSLRVTASGRAPVRVELPPGAKGEQRVAMVVGGTVAVAVVDGDGKPVAGVEVELRGGEGGAGGTTDKTTDADGRVRFENLAIASYRVRIAPQGPRLPAQFRVEGMPQLPLGGGDAGWTDVVVAADRETVEVTLTKAATATLTGIVRENGLPLADARVAFVAGPARGDAAEAGAEGAAMEMVEGVFEQFAPGGGGGRSARTDQGGAFTLKELPEGTHRLRVTHRGRAMPFEVPIVLRLGEQDTVVELDMTAIRGVVLDAQGQPVAGARVSVRQARGDGMPDVGAAVEGMMPGMNFGGSASQQARSDDSGQYELRGVAPGVPLQVRATARGHAPAATEVTVQQGEVRNGVEVRLLAGGKIAVTVEGQAQPFAMVMAMRVVDGKPTGTPAMQMLRRGKATLADLEPGTYEVRFQGMQDPRNGGGDEKKQQVEVVAGETVTVAF